MNSLSIPSELPWWRSKIIIGALISMITKILVVSGLIGELAPEDAEQLTNIVVLLIGGFGDILAIGSRVTQKHSPAITATTPPQGVSSFLVVGLILPLMLSACTPGAILPPPSSVADRTVLDEKAGTFSTNTYTALSTGAALLIRSGAIRNPATVRWIGELDKRGYAAVLALRAAYDAGNAADYLAAKQKVDEAIAGFSAVIKGEGT